jgi:uncharacterized membrane protein YozB (DUF420 family)
MRDFSGIDGFLGTRASLTLDVLVVAMLVVLLVLGYSVYQSRWRRRHNLHKWIQLVLGVILLVVVILFEIDIRIHGWQSRAAGGAGGQAAPSVFAALYVHLLFAVSTVVLWPIVIFRALRSFPTPPAPNEHSRWHRRWGKIAAIDMALTAITGWIFYWLAFVR